METDIVQQATEMGWRDLPEYHGDPEKWVDAETFVKKGEVVLPIMKENNKKLQAKLATTQAEVQRLAGLVQGSQASMEELKKLHQDNLKREIEKTKKELLAGMKEARGEGDVEREFELRTSYDDLNKQAEELAKAPPAPPTKPQIDPEFAAWVEETPWWEKDKRKTAFAVTIAQEMKNDPQYAGVTGRKFLNLVSKEVEETFGSTRRESRVEEGGAGGSRASSGSYATLSSEAKAVCERQAENMVGEGKAFKTKKEWQSYYAKMVEE